MKKKLNEIQLCPAILHLRPVNDVFVSRYRQAMRNGDEFPKIIIDQDDKIISGSHRYSAYLEEYGEDHAIEVTREKFRDEASRIERAVVENARHGNPLDGISRKRAILRLNELGRTAEAIAKLLGVSCKRVEELAGMSVIVIGKGNKRHSEPVKRGLEHMAGAEVTTEEYETHRTKDRGVPAKQSAQQLIRWINAGWIDQTDASTIDTLQELAALIRAEFSQPWK
jgi:hypothetical protein